MLSSWSSVLDLDLLEYLYGGGGGARSVKDVSARLNVKEVE
jgi:hypothetical protein